MIEITLILILLLAVAWAAARTIRRFRHGGGCCGEHEAATKKIRGRDHNRSHYPYRVLLDIDGMTCENCARRVENSLNALDGIWAKVDLGSRQADVLLKNPPDETLLLGTIANAGYLARVSGDN